MAENPWEKVFEEEPSGNEEMSWEEGLEVIQEQQVDEDPEDSELSQDTLGLLQLGHLSSKINVFGNEVRIKTLTVGEELEIGLLTKQYLNTSEQGRAYGTAVVAASIVSINKKRLPIKPLGPDDEANVLNYKFEYVSRKYYWPVIEKIYDEYMKLLARQLAALEEIKKK
jgi:hypothetical protein